MRSSLRHCSLAVVLAVFTACCLAGCEKDDSPAAVPTSPAAPATSPQAAANPPPAGLVTVNFQGRTLRFWPYAGTDCGGRPVSPINLVFVGKASPLQIRAALLSLDGDRRGHLPPGVPPFNWLWSDAMGEIRTTFIDGEGWVGSTVKLQLGTFDQLRWHLWLFPARAPFGGGVWTLGTVSCEAFIPGGVFHQDFSWELAKQFVLADLARSGLLNAAAPYVSTRPINAAPTFGAIPAFIYNHNPDELNQLFGGPPGPVSDDVPIPSDGRALLFDFADSRPIVPGRFELAYTADMMNVLRRPPCLAGPTDLIVVQGPVTFTKRISVTRDGLYEHAASVSSRLTVTSIPWFPGLPPILDGAPSRLARESEGVSIWPGGWRLWSVSSQIASQDGTPEVLLSELIAASGFPLSCRTQASCLTALQ